MGLDAVELVVEIEKAFGINLPDKECEQIRTVGDLQQLVLKYVEPTGNQACHTSYVFYKLRRSFQDITGVDRNDFTPSLPLETLLPVKHRKSDWRELQLSSRLKLPLLEKPDWYNHINSFFVFASIIVLVASFFSDNTIRLIIGVIFFWLVLYLIGLATEPIRKHLPVSQVKELVLETAVLNFRHVMKKRSASADDVRNIVAFIIAEKLGVDILEVTPQAGLTDDLGMD